LRLLAGICLVAHEASVLSGGVSGGHALLAVVSIIMGALLILGLWTPVAGTLVAVIALWNVYSHPADQWSFVAVGILGLSLALLGPGAWSVDARLFGWKRLEIPDRKE
jgi:uncharacterized membrane protein YphA (DoxX/SURF4 family)